MDDEGGSPHLRMSVIFIEKHLDENPPLATSGKACVYWYNTDTP